MAIMWLQKITLLSLTFQCNAISKQDDMARKSASVDKQDNALDIEEDYEENANLGGNGMIRKLAVDANGETEPAKEPNPAKRKTVSVDAFGNVAKEDSQAGQLVRASLAETTTDTECWNSRRRNGGKGWTQASPTKAKCRPFNQCSMPDAEKDDEWADCKTQLGGTHQSCASLANSHKYHYYQYWVNESDTSGSTNRCVAYPDCDNMNTGMAKEWILCQCDYCHYYYSQSSYYNYDYSSSIIRGYYYY